MTQIVEDVNFVPGAKYTLSWKGGTPQVLTAPASGHWTLPNIPITATEIQLELGEVATPFERRSYGQELALCERYYQQSWTGDAAAALATDGDSVTCALSNTSGQIVGTAFLRSTMRATPNILEKGSGASAAGWVLMNGSGTPSAKTGILTGKGDRRTIKVQVPVGGVTAGQSYALIGNWIADAEL